MLGARVVQPGGRWSGDYLVIEFAKLQASPDTFYFYEVYQDDGPAIDFHKSTPHYKAWADFKANNPTAVVSQTVVKADGVDL